MKKFLYLLAAFLTIQNAFAGGYRVSAQGQRALAMGHTGVAVVNSAELAFFNPAGIIFLENKLNVSAGVTGVISTSKYQNPQTRETAETDSGISTPFNAYATYKFNKWFAAAVAVYSPYGSKVEWNKNWVGSDLVNSIDLKAIYINPTVSIKLEESFSIGGGPIFVTGSVDFDRNLDRREGGNNDNRPNVAISESGVTNWGWTVSALFKPSDKFALGVNYRSKIDLTVDSGNVNFTNASFANATFGATLPLPAELTFGFSVQATKKLLLAAEFNRAYWGVYDSLDITFTNTNSNDPLQGAPESINSRNYKNTTIWRVGSQYNLNDKLELRAGYYFDESPVASGFYSPETPRNDSHGFTSGFSYNINSKLAIDLALTYLYFKEVDESFDSNPNDTTPRLSGTFKSNAYLGGLGITYKL